MSVGVGVGVGVGVSVGVGVGEGGGVGGWGRVTGVRAWLEGGGWVVGVAVRVAGVGVGEA